MGDSVLQRVTDADIHELVDAHRSAWVQGRDQLGGEKSVRFRILQAILNASAQSASRWIRLNASSTQSALSELDNFIAEVSKGDLVGKSVETLSPSAVLKRAIRSFVIHAQGWMIALTLISVSAMFVWKMVGRSGLWLGHAVVVVGNILLLIWVVGAAFSVFKAMMEEFDKSSTGTSAAHSLTRPGQNIFEQQTMPTLTRFYARFNRRPPGVPIVRKINNTADTTAGIIWMCAFLVVGWFLYSAIGGAITAVRNHEWGSGNACVVLNICPKPPVKWSPYPGHLHP